ncbi:aminotransferase class V-fold PLP-dependent enzyme [Aliikangiella maris]|uniref:Aminotransferase class V-fold PLP-dependent enzyme n=2 Tax=Aliikangiella maris TaxID=3162458 RepID=A0ABV2BWG8_9GAMM
MLPNKIGSAFLGMDILYHDAHNKPRTRIYLDSAASTLALAPAQQATQQFLKYYSNTHSSVHLTAKISSEVVNWAQKSILSFFGASEGYDVVFQGSGATSPLNRLAKGMRTLQKDKKIVMVSLMEHHSNDLPHRVHDNNVIHIPVYDKNGEFIGIDLDTIEALCKEYEGQINYIAVTAASNVSGHISPIHDIAEIAHKYGAYIVVDGAQIAAHSPLQLNQQDPARSIDFFVFSGHKTYAPGSPGVLIAKTELLNQLEPEFYGGGMVAEVSQYNYQVASQSFDKEHAGTINIPGIFMLASVLAFLDKLGMEKIYQEECELTEYLISQLTNIPEVKVYADTLKKQRIGAVSFNLKDMPHELLSLILNDYFAIAVRNDCFCAHPFVRECLVDELWDIEDEEDLPLYRGMVRASIGLYTTKEHIDALCEALKEIVTKRDFYISQYERTRDNHFTHKTFSINTNAHFDISKTLDQIFSPYFESCGA